MRLSVDEPCASRTFIARLNTFLGIAEVGGVEERVHIHDLGRLTELLRPGVKIHLRCKATGKAR